MAARTKTPAQLRAANEGAVEPDATALAVFDVLAYEADVQAKAAEAPKFTVPVLNAAGERRLVELIDANTLPWQALLTINNPVKFLAWCVKDEDQEDFFDHTPMSGATMRQLAERYREFYEIGDNDYGADAETQAHLESVRKQRRGKRRR